MKTWIFPSSARLLAVAMTLTQSAHFAAAQQFTEIDPGLPGKFLPCVAVGDYDGDGDLDVLVAANGKHDIPFATIYQNTGGIYTDSGIVLPGLSRATAAWGDFDGDGDLDLAMTGVENNGAPFTGPARTRIYRNNGSTFSLVPGSFLGVFAGSVAWGDCDGDGDLDLLVSGLTLTSAEGVATTRLYRNDHGVFTAVAHPFPDCYSGAVSWGDYNNDGKLDVVIAGTGPGGLVAAIWRNDGGGAFTNLGVPLPGMDLGFAVWGDYDNDGDLDLLFGGDSYSMEGSITRIYRNDGGTFTDVNAGLQGLLWAAAAWGDYDNDGDLDVMVIGYDPVAQVPRSILYRNDAGTLVDSGATFHNLYLGTVSWMDYDNDGDLDLLLAGNTSGTDVLRIYHNNNVTLDTAPSVPMNPVANVIGTGVDFSWNAASDTQTPAAGLSYNLRVGTTPGGSQIVAPQASAAGSRRLVALGNAQLGLTAQLRTLVPGTTYYWSVQSVDSAFVGSVFAAEGSFTALADPPQNVSFARAAGGAVHVIWRGTPGSTYRVEVSPDLQSWVPVATPAAAAGTGLFELIETPASNIGQRYYRAARP
ncbi:MAG: VCBS repeat-containing protein [Verrucomicrobia bacterium]|nr:VCBS repeat-containing protein [Verrucomicrobiota bacterium]